MKHDSEALKTVAGLCCLVRADSNATKTRYVRTHHMER
jgi:hypothetical protein